MKRVPKIIVLSFLLVIGVVGLAYVGIMAYIHYDVFGKSPSYEGTRQNFIKNEPCFQKTENCFLEIADCCLPDSSKGTLLFSILESGDEFMFRLFFSTENETELVFPIRDSNIEITQDQKEQLQSRGIDYKKVQTLYSNLKKKIVVQSQKTLVIQMFCFIWHLRYLIIVQLITCFTLSLLRRIQYDPSQIHRSVGESLFL